MMTSKLKSLGDSSSHHLQWAGRILWRPHFRSHSLSIVCTRPDLAAWFCLDVLRLRNNSDFRDSTFSNENSRFNCLPMFLNSINSYVHWQRCTDARVFNSFQLQPRHNIQDDCIHRYNDHRTNAVDYRTEADGDIIISTRGCQRVSTTSSSPTALSK